MILEKERTNLRATTVIIHRLNLTTIDNNTSFEHNTLGSSTTRILTATFNSKPTLN